jgi:hypothetical protein
VGDVLGDVGAPAQALRHVRGKLTTAGIVAEIVHVGRLFGRSSEDRQQTREKVAKALDRRRHPRW